MGDIGIRCMWLNNRPVETPFLLLQPARWAVSLHAPGAVFRWELVTITVNVEVQENGAGPDTLWYLSTMSCTLSASPSEALSHPDNIVSTAARYNSTILAAIARFRVRIGYERGAVIGIKAACAVNGLSVGHAMDSILVNQVDLEWEQRAVTWFPSSGEYQPPITPPLVLSMKTNGTPVNSTKDLRCTLRIGNPLEDALALLQPPAGGYAGEDASSFLTFDRVVISGPFGITAALIAECTLGLDTFEVQPAFVNLREPSISFRTAPPPNIVSAEAFALSLQVLPEDELSKQYGTISCRLSAPGLSSSGAEAIAYNGTVEFPAVQFDGVLGTNHTATVLCALGTQGLSTVLTFSFTFEDCAPGEEPTVDKEKCIPCTEDAYSPGGTSRCRKCPSLGASCINGRLVVHDGYYPADSRYLNLRDPDLPPIDASTVLYPCWNSESCNRNHSTQQISCSIGYRGPLCGVCDSQMGYAATGGACIQCWPEALNIAFVAAFGFAILLLVTYISIFQKVKEASPAKIIVRIGLTYVQMLSSLGLFKAQATSTFRSMVGATEAVGASFTALPPLQCLFHFGYYARYSMNLTFPFLLVPLSILVALCAAAFQSICTCPRKHKHAAEDASASQPVVRNRQDDSIDRSSCSARVQQYWKRREFVAPAVFIMYFFYSSVSAAMATMYKCRDEVIDGEQYLAADLSIQCYTNAHITGMVLTGAVGLLYSLGFPLSVWIGLRRCSHKLRTPDVFEKFGFLYQGYSHSRNVVWWEALVMMRKFCIVLAASVLDDPWYQSIAGIAIVVIALALQLRFHPYEETAFNYLEDLVLISLAVTQVITLLYLRAETAGIKPDAQGDTDVIVTLLLVAINAATLVVVFVMAFKACRRKPRRSNSNKASLNAPLKSKRQMTPGSKDGWFPNPVHRSSISLVGKDAQQLVAQLGNAGKNTTARHQRRHKGKR